MSPVEARFAHSDPRPCAPRRPAGWERAEAELRKIDAAEFPLGRKADYKMTMKEESKHFSRDEPARGR